MRSVSLSDVVVCPLLGSTTPFSPPLDVHSHSLAPPQPAHLLLFTCPDPTFLYFCLPLSPPHPFLRLLTFFLADDGQS